VEDPLDEPFDHRLRDREDQDGDDESGRMHVEPGDEQCGEQQPERGRADEDRHADEEAHHVRRLSAGMCAVNAPRQLAWALGSKALRAQDDRVTLGRRPQ